MDKRTGVRVEKNGIEWVGEEPAHRRGKIGSLFQANVIRLVIWHCDGRIRDANDAYLKLVGYSPSDISQGTFRCDLVTPEEYHSRDEFAITELLQGKAVYPVPKRVYPA